MTDFPFPDPGKIQKIQSPMLDSNTPMVQISKVDQLFGSAQRSGILPVEAHFLILHAAALEDAIVHEPGC